VDESAEGQSVVPAGGEVCHRDLEHGKPFSHQTTTGHPPVINKAETCQQAVSDQLATQQPVSHQSSNSQ
jgi:hypothetical protein